MSPNHKQFCTKPQSKEPHESVAPFELSDLDFDSLARQSVSLVCLHVISTSSHKFQIQNEFTIVRLLQLPKDISLIY